MRLEFCHFDSVDSALVTLVAQLAAAAILRLLEVVGGEKSVDDRDFLCGIEARNTVGDTLADIVEVRSLATNHTTQDDDSIVAAIEHHLMGAVDKLGSYGRIQKFSNDPRTHYACND